jgi:putative tricarboxylic transport membrane protein
MMADFFQGTLLLFSDPLSVALFVAALLGGMAFGAVPGVNMLTLGAVLLPFSATLSTEHALMVYAVIYCTGVFGGAITAILFNIPGSPENAPTAIDGYAMARRGEAAKAVGAAVVCSALGGVVSALVMMSATPLVAHWATRAFGPPEVFSLIVLGLAVSIGVGAGDLWRGALSVLLGLLLATVGSDPADGIPRYDFGSYYLLAGIGFIPVLLGLFAVSEVLDKVARREKGPGQAGPLRFAPPSFAPFPSVCSPDRSPALGRFWPRS